MNIALLSEKAMAPHSSTLAWKIPWKKEPGRLQSMGSLRVGHNWATSLSLFTFMHWRRKWQPTQCSCLENPRDGGAWWAAVYGLAQSRTRLKRLSSSKVVVVRQGCILSPAYLTHMQSTSWEMLGWMKHKLESRLPGEISITSDADDTTLMAESEEELKSLVMKVKEESEKLA